MHWIVQMCTKMTNSKNNLLQNKRHSAFIDHGKLSAMYCSMQYYYTVFSGTKTFRIWSRCNHLDFLFTYKMVLKIPLVKSCIHNTGVI
jgi:hypothetical protein